MVLQERLDKFNLNVNLFVARVCWENGSMNDVTTIIINALLFLFVPDQTLKTKRAEDRSRLWCLRSSICIMDLPAVQTVIEQTTLFLHGNGLVRLEASLCWFRNVGYTRLHGQRAGLRTACWPTDSMLARDRHHAGQTMGRTRWKLNVPALGYHSLREIKRKPRSHVVRPYLR